MQGTLNKRSEIRQNLEDIEQLCRSNQIDVAVDGSMIFSPGNDVQEGGSGVPSPVL